MALRVTGGVYERHRPNAGDKNDPHDKSNVACFSNGFDQISSTTTTGMKKHAREDDKIFASSKKYESRACERKGCVYSCFFTIILIFICNFFEFVNSITSIYSSIEDIDAPQTYKMSDREDHLFTDSIIPTIKVNEEVLNGNNIQWILNKEKDDSMFISHSTYQHQHNTSTKIPKIIHKILITNDGKAPDIKDYSMNANLIHALNSWTRRNPRYSMKAYGMDDCKAYLKDYFHPVFIRAFNCIVAYAGKTNLCRAAIVYREGGWYSDWMEEVQVDGLLDTLSTGNQTIVFPWARTKEYEMTQGSIMNGFFGAQPRHPMLAETLKIIVLNVNREYYGEFAQDNTGQGVMGRAYKKYYNNGMDTKKLSTFPVLTGWYSGRLEEKGISEYQFTNMYGNTTVIVHKCDGCSFKDDYGTASNDYRQLFFRKQYYCAQATSLLISPKDLYKESQ